MSDGNRKSPFSDVTDGDEKDWDKALNAWEVPAGSPGPKAKDAPPPAATKTTKLPPAAPPRPAGPPRPAPAEKTPRGSEPIDDDDDAATLVAQISPELLADAGAPSEKGSELDQILRRQVPASPLPPGEPIDALLDMLFENPEDLARPGPDSSVVTSAPEVELDDRGTIPDQERNKDSEEPLDDAPEGSLLDPFSPARDDRAPTMRPGVTGESAAAAAAQRAEEATTSRSLTPLPAIENDAKDSFPPERISLDSVPPDSMPPPLLELPGVGDLHDHDIQASELSPAIRTLRGGHGLPRRCAVGDNAATAGTQRPSRTRAGQATF